MSFEMGGSDPRVELVKAEINRISEAAMKRISELLFPVLPEASALRIQMDCKVDRSGSASIIVSVGGWLSGPRPGRQHPDCDDLKPKKKEEKCKCEHECDDKKDHPKMSSALNEALNQLAEEIDKKNKKGPDAQA